MNISKKDSQAGFTLLELLIVAICVIVLVAIVAFAFRGVPERAKLARARADITGFMAALDLYKDDVKAYPDSLQKLLTDTAAGWRGPYLNPNTAFVDPWGSTYFYRLDSPTRYTIYSFGPDKTDNGGSGDDIKPPF